MEGFATGYGVQVTEKRWNYIFITVLFRIVYNSCTTGDIYRGIFSFGDFHGFGTLTKATGMVLKGQWVGGEFTAPAEEEEKEEDENDDG